MDLLSHIDILPPSLDPTLKIVIYVLIIVHALALGIWACATIPSILKPEKEFEKNYKNFVKKNQSKEKTH